MEHRKCPKKQGTRETLSKARGNVRINSGEVEGKHVGCGELLLT